MFGNLISESQSCNFFVSGSQGKPSKPATANGPKEETVVKDPAPTKKIVNLNEPRTCKNKGCGKTYKEKDNHETACEYHPGPAVFHDRMRGVGPFLFPYLSTFMKIFNFRLWCRKPP